MYCAQTENLHIFIAVRVNKNVVRLNREPESKKYLKFIGGFFGGEELPHRGRQMAFETMRTMM